jgi:hypothetical protein
MMTVLLVFAVRCLLTFGIMMVAAAGALPPQRFRPARYQAGEKSIALLLERKRRECTRIWRATPPPAN